jgi:hypothetical protein
LRFTIGKQFASTTQLPTLQSDIRTLLPEILVAACDNPDNKPFFKEMLDTQTAHLFEHMVLEYLCKLRLNEGASEASYEGRTFWDARRPTGEESTIAVSRQGESKSQFMRAVRLSSKLLNTLLSNTSVHVTLHTERGAEPLPMYLD